MNESIRMNIETIDILIIAVAYTIGTAIRCYTLIRNERAKVIADCRIALQREYLGSNPDYIDNKTTEVFGKNWRRWF